MKATLDLNSVKGIIKMLNSKDEEYKELGYTLLTNVNTKDTKTMQLLKACCIVKCIPEKYRNSLKKKIYKRAIFNPYIIEELSKENIDRELLLFIVKNRTLN